MFRFHSFPGDERAVIALDRHNFPPPWAVEEQSACFVVRDLNGQALIYVYFEEEPDQWQATKLRTKDEARRIAVNFALAASRRLVD